MEFFIKSVESILIIIGLGFFGFFLLFKKLLTKDVLKVLSPIVIDFAVPAMIFADMIKNFKPENISDWWIYPFYWFGSFLFGILLSYFFSIFVKNEHRKEFILSLVYPNALFIPIVLVTNLYGENSEMLVKLYLFTFIFPVFLFNFYKIFIDVKNIKLNFRILFNPIIVVTLIGILIKILNLEKFIPYFVVNITSRIGALSIPVILLIIGGNLYIQFKNKNIINWGGAIYFTITKNVLFPLIHIFILKIINLTPDLSFLIFIQSAVPPVTAIPILIERENRNTVIVNQYLLFSFIFSIISLPLMFLLFKLYL